MSRITDNDKKYIIGTYNRFPIAIVRGEGSLLFDENGREYIDLGSGIAVNSFGACDGEWYRAVCGQAGKIQHTSNLYYTEPCTTLAEALCTRAGMRKVFFSNSGAEANECAIKLARKYAFDKYGDGRYTVVTLNNSFHGRTLTTLAATGQEHYHELFRPLTPGFCSVDAGDIAAIESIHGKTPVCAVMIECIQGEGGVIPLDESFVKDLAAWCAENDVLLIVDEVQTGNGRTGEYFAYMNYGIKPDIVTTAKGLAGGLPIGATLTGYKAEFTLGYGDHGSTFGGNPVCCAAALSIIGRIDDALLCSVKEKGLFIKESLAGQDGIEDVRGMGLMIGVKTVRPVAEVTARCIERGVLCLTAKDSLRLLPPLNIGKDTLARALEIIKEACAAQ